MPCDSVIENSIDLPKMHPTLYGAALKALGAQPLRDGVFTLEGESFRLQGGELTGLSGQSAERVGSVADRLKQKYSHQVVNMQAARNGWTVQATGPNSYNVIKR